MAEKIELSCETGFITYSDGDVCACSWSKADVAGYKV